MVIFSTDFFCRFGWHFDDQWCMQAMSAAGVRLC